MKKWLRAGIYLIAFLLFYWAIIPKYRHKLIYSKDKAKIITATTYPNNILVRNSTYFTPGVNKKNKIPDVFVNPDYTSDNDWVIYVTFHSKGVFFLGHATVKNISDTFFYLPSSFTEYRQSLKIDSLKSTFRNSEDTTLIWTDFE